MADGLRVLRWRAAVMLVGAGLVFAWVVMSGRTRHTIQIDFSWHAQALDSAIVEIDDSIVGALVPYSEATSSPDSVWHPANTSSE
jgi:hypothetical protein